MNEKQPSEFIIWIGNYLPQNSKWNPLRAYIKFHLVTFRFFFWSGIPSCIIHSNPLIYTLLAFIWKFWQVNLPLNTHYVPNIMPDTAVINLKEICLLPAVKDLKSHKKALYLTRSVNNRGSETCKGLGWRDIRYSRKCQH